MCDFWVSKAKHYCNYCKVWCQGSKESIKRHEDGKWHKDRVAAILKKKRMGPQRTPDERDLQKQLAEIEAAAAASMGASARGDRGAFAGAMNVDASRLPQSHNGGAPSLKATSWPGMHDAGGHREQPREWAGHTWRMPGQGGPAAREEDEEEEALLPPDDDGTYVVRGTTYFAGDKHVDKLRTRGAVEVWLEAADAWVPAAIVKVKRFSKGADSGETRVYDVRLTKPEPPTAPPTAPPPPDAAPAAWDAWRRAEAARRAPPEKEAPLSRTARHLAAVNGDDAILKDIRAKDLRVAAGADGEFEPETVDFADGADRPPPESVPAPVPEERDEATGLGKWQTVSVRLVDEAAEAAKAEAQRKRDADRAARADAKRRRDETADADRADWMCEREAAADALSSQLGVNDRTDEYRGIKLAPDARPAAEDAPAPARPPRAPALPPPAFKKRRVNAAFRKKAS